MGEVKEWPIAAVRSGLRAGMPCNVGVERMEEYAHWWSSHGVVRFRISVSQPRNYFFPLQWSVWADTPEECDLALKTICAGLQQRGYAPKITYTEKEG